MSIGSSFRRGCTPQSSRQRRTTSLRGDSASTGAFGRYAEINAAVVPVFVGETMHLSPSW